MRVRVKIFNEQQLLAMAACIWMRTDRKIYDKKGILIRTVPDYDRSKITYNPQDQLAIVVCDDEKTFEQLQKSGFDARRL